MTALIVDTKQVERLSKKLESLWSDMGAELSEDLASASVDLVADGFDSESDPYGKKWLATARGGEILSDTGALKTSVKVKSFSPSRFVVDASVKYASTHQSGATIKPKSKSVLRFKIGKQWVFASKVKIPARPFFPNRKLPVSWLKEYVMVADELLEERLS